MKLAKYSIGIGDRFAHQGRAQLQAVIDAKKSGVDVTPVWNKSFREHTIIGSKPQHTRGEADAAVNALAWQAPYFVDADHIGLKTADFFIDSCDFFTIDVADFIGQPAEAKNINAFLGQFGRYQGELKIPGVDAKYVITKDKMMEIAQKYLLAIEQAGEIYRYILSKKTTSDFIVEVSMDETALPQTPIELFFILAGLKEQQVPLSTIAPKFSGRFNKGIDYVGDVAQFSREFAEDVAIIHLAIDEFALPSDLKLSVHSGSDKFSLYASVHGILKEMNAGVHLKTAGTTWLEELIGLAESGGAALDLVKEIYHQAICRYDELCKPYITVIDIDRGQLPDVPQVDKWDENQFTAALRHDPENSLYNKHFRQLLHVAFRVAAEMGQSYLTLLEENAEIIAKNVTENIFQRHLAPLFIGSR